MTSEQNGGTSKADIIKADWFNWVVNARYQNQSFSIKLFKLEDDLKKQKDRECHKIFHTLLGVNFSLWRAAPLVLESARDEEEIDITGFQFLDTLIAENAINFPQDKKMRAWSSGYYLNNAYYRVVSLKGKLSESGIDFSILEESNRNLLFTDTQRYWDDLHKCAENILEYLSESIKSK